MKRGVLTLPDSRRRLLSVLYVSEGLPKQTKHIFEMCKHVYLTPMLHVHASYLKNRLIKLSKILNTYFLMWVFYYKKETQQFHLKYEEICMHNKNVVHQ